MNVGLFAEPGMIVIEGMGLIVLLAVIILGRRIEAQVGKVHFELRPNGGSTVRDAIDRIEERVQLLEDFVERIDQ